jgi:hypothetical protein
MPPAEVAAMLLRAVKEANPDRRDDRSSPVRVNNDMRAVIDRHEARPGERAERERIARQAREARAKQRRLVKQIITERKMITFEEYLDTSQPFKPAVEPAVRAGKSVDMSLLPPLPAAAMLSDEAVRMLEEDKPDLNKWACRLWEEYKVLPELVREEKRKRHNRKRRAAYKRHVKAEAIRLERQRAAAADRRAKKRKPKVKIARRARSARRRARRGGEADQA